MSDTPPYSAACERNRDPILAVLRRHFAHRARVLEIGSGTGQHAVHFAAALPHVHWQATDRIENLDGIRAWIGAAALPNLPPPLELDVTGDDWPAQRYDAVFSANTLHIMPWESVRALFARLPEVLADDSVVAIYGPFNRDGRFTSDSNAAFDATLRRADPLRGIRDAAEVDALAAAAGLVLVEDVEMPANNRLRIWHRTAVG